MSEVPVRGARDFIAYGIFADDSSADYSGFAAEVDQLLPGMVAAGTRIDFVHFPLIHYFYAAPERASLPQAIGHLLGVTERGREGRPERVRLTVATLRTALEDFDGILATRFLDADPQKILMLYSPLSREITLPPPLDQPRSASGGRALGGR